MPKPPRWLILLAFACVYICWGATFVAMRYAVKLLHPGFVSGFRFFIAGLIVLSILKLRGNSLSLSRREWKMAAIVGLIMLTGNNFLVAAAESYLTAGLTALIAASIPLFIAVFEAVLPGGSSMGALGWLGTLGGLAGLTLLMWNSMGGNGKPAEGAVFGCIILTIASIAWAIGSIIMRRVHLQVKPILFAGWQMVIAGAVNIGIASVAGGWKTAQWTPGALLCLAYLVLFGSLAGYLSYQFLVRSVKLSAVATYAYVNPIVTVLLSIAFLGESLHGIEWLGMAVILVSVAIVITAKPRVRKELQPEE